MKQVIKLLDEHSVSEEISKYYCEIKHGLTIPFVPNFFKGQAHSLSMLQGIWGAVRNILLNGKLPRSLKEMILVAISNSRNCGYCSNMHYAMCKLLGIEEKDLTIMLHNVEELSPELTKKIMKFALRCAEDPQALKDEDYEGLRKLGVSDEEMVEVIAMSALSVFLNILADGMKISLDDSVEKIL